MVVQPLGRTGRLNEVVEESERQHDVEAATQVGLKEIGFDQLDVAEPLEPRRCQLEHARREVDADVRPRTGVEDRLGYAAGAAADVEDVRRRVPVPLHDRDGELPPALRAAPKVRAGAPSRVQAVERARVLVKVASR